MNTELLQAIIADQALEVMSEPIRLASGDNSRYFIDVKRALADGRNLRLAAELIIELADNLGVEWDVVGGMTMGADAISHGVALLTGRSWFTVRKNPKVRGTNRMIEGAVMDRGMKVLLVDDVVSRGGSIRKAHHAVNTEGAKVVLATAIVDRGDYGTALFAEVGVPYNSLISYRDLGIPKVGDERVQ